MCDENCTTSLACRPKVIKESLIKISLIFWNTGVLNLDLSIPIMTMFPDLNTVSSNSTDVVLREKNEVIKTKMMMHENT